MFLTPRKETFCSFSSRPAINQPAKNIVLQLYPIQPYTMTGYRQALRQEHADKVVWILSMHLNVHILQENLVGGWEGCRTINLRLARVCPAWQPGDSSDGVQMEVILSRAHAHCTILQCWTILRILDHVLRYPQKKFNGVRNSRKFKNPAAPSYGVFCSLSTVLARLNFVCSTFWECHYIFLDFSLFHTHVMYSRPSF